MRIALDMDGVLYEWDRTARYMLRVYRGCTGLEQESTEWFYKNQTWHDVGDDDWRWLWSDGVRLGLFRHGHVATGAIVGMRDLAEAGHRLYVVTSRPESAVNDTLGWLSYHMQDVPLSGVTILSDGQPKSVVEADVLVDDRLGNVYEWPRRSLLFDRPWNQHRHIESPEWDPKRMRRVFGWKGVVDALRN